MIISKDELLSAIRRNPVLFSCADEIDNDVILAFIDGHGDLNYLLNEIRTRTENYDYMFDNVIIEYISTNYVVQDIPTSIVRCIVENDDLFTKYFSYLKCFFEKKDSENTFKSFLHDHKEIWPNINETNLKLIHTLGDDILLRYIVEQIDAEKIDKSKMEVIIDCCPKSLFPIKIDCTFTFTKIIKCISKKRDLLVKALKSRIFYFEYENHRLVEIAEENAFDKKLLFYISLYTDILSSIPYLCDDYIFMDKLIRRRPQSIRYASKKIQQIHKEKVLKRNYRLIELYSEDNDYTDRLNILVKKDDELITEHNIRYIKDLDLVCKKIGMYPIWYKSLTVNQKTKDISLLAVSKMPTLVEYLPASLKNDIDIWIKALTIRQLPTYGYGKYFYEKYWIEDQLESSMLKHPVIQKILAENKRFVFGIEETKKSESTIEKNAFKKFINKFR